MPDLRTWVYVQRPRDYGIAGCPCGNDDPDFSEYAGELWCRDCKRDFTPTHNGIFDGPIGVNAARLLGFDLRRRDLTTGEILPAPGEEIS